MAPQETGNQSRRMNLKTARLVHLYLGCFFTPLLVFFVITGCFQIFDLHEQHKNAPYSARAEFLGHLSDVHMKGGQQEKGPVSWPFRLVVLAMTMGFVIMSGLGVWMAFRFSQKPILVWVCLLSGTLVILKFILKAFAER